MEGSGGEEFLFCNLCGTMLSFDSVEYASCPLCKSRRNTREIAGREICYTITNERFRRNLHLNQSKNNDSDMKKLEVNEPCPKCGNDKLEYYVRQLRSADEGHTVFYECPKCPHKHVVNT
ncbi:DNA-directed RNA polymerase I subunit RPA12-like [Nymphaea colorata]|nr:DNA-directed RNA polymerase I subunit RPA12-like [Nymphaea colorata]